MDIILFVVATIVVAVVIRVLSKPGGGARESIRAAVERATAVPPPMTTGMYAAPGRPDQQSSGHAWPAPPSSGAGNPWTAPPQSAPGGYMTHNVPMQGHAQRRAAVPQGDLDARVRELMENNNEVGAVRLLCDEAQMGIIDAQDYARRLVGPAPAMTPTDAPAGGTVAEEKREFGSAAFATSIFETGEDEGWASGWKDTPEPEDRTDIDELWQTVRSAGSGQQTGNGS
jgi:hypothetical protein